MQAGVEKLATVVGVTLGPKGRTVVMESSIGGPRLVNDGVTVAKEVELYDAIENIGARLVRQAACKTNDQAGDGTTSATLLSAALIREGMKIIAAGGNPVEIVKGIEKTIKELVLELQNSSLKLRTDQDMMNIAAVSAGNDKQIGKLIADAMTKVGRQGVVTLQESKTARDELTHVEGMQFDRGFYSRHFVTDTNRMVVEYENCGVLLVNKTIETHQEIIVIMEESIKKKYPLLILAKDIKHDVLATLIVNRLRGSAKIVAVKAPGFGDRTTQYLEDIAILTGATVVQEHSGIAQYNINTSVLGMASKVSVDKDTCTIVGDGSYHDAVIARVRQIETLLGLADATYEKQKLKERMARLATGVAIIAVGAQTETELNEKKFRVEDALCATRAAVEEGIVMGGGCTLLKLSQQVNNSWPKLGNDEQKIGAEIVKKALPYPLRLMAHNAGVNGAVVQQKIMENKEINNFGYNAMSDTYEDLMLAGIIDPTKVIRCGLESASSVARTFMLADVILTTIADTRDRTNERTERETSTERKMF
jgi:chaperonin GroEL